MKVKRKLSSPKTILEILAAVFTAAGRQPSMRDPSYWKNPELERSCLMKSIVVREYISA